jgi:hypothetical protein
MCVYCSNLLLFAREKYWEHLPDKTFFTVFVKMY